MVITPKGLHACGEKSLMFSVTMTSARAITAAASTCRSPSSFGIEATMLRGGGSSIASGIAAFIASKRRLTADGSRSGLSAITFRRASSRISAVQCARYRRRPASVMSRSVGKMPKRTFASRMTGKTATCAEPTGPSPIHQQSRASSRERLPAPAPVGRGSPSGHRT